MSEKTVGRFEIVHELGRGMQSVVYLARDPQFGRRVAVKILHALPSSQTEGVLREARKAANLRHSNIVTLLDTGAHDGMPYLVYSYVEGSTLAQLTWQKGVLPPVRAAQIAVGVLDALACAHAEDVMHLDIKPANIMIVADGTPQVMDFGIAHLISQGEEAGGIFGVPQYMAPECIAGKAVDARADLFSVGVILREMVSGSAADAESASRTDIRTTREKLAASSRRVVTLDDKLKSIIQKATASKPENRYSDANAMRKALQDYIEPPLEEGGADDGMHSTVEFLLRRMRSNSDFPALSATISEINAIIASEVTSAGKLVQVILQDFALTNKLLKLVNTASYGQYGGSIHTISKAVTILGFEAVRNIATSLILLELLQNRPQAAKLKNEIAISYLAGMVAANLVQGYGVNAEEARICAMFRNLGRMLVIYYFYEESQQIARLVQEQGLSEEEAAVNVLGISYDSIGADMAELWHFPGNIIGAMKKLPEGNIDKSQGEVELMSVVSGLACELCAVAATGSPQDKEKLLAQLCERYQQALPVSSRGLSAALENGMQEFAKRAEIVGINTAKNAVLNKVSKWNGSAGTGKQDESGNEAISLDAAANSGGAALRADPDAVLSSGIQDVTNTLVEDYQLNDVLLVVLETIYCSLGFRHALIFIRDDQRGVMAARFGFGEDVEKLMPLFRFPLQFVPDVFHLALDQGLDIVIEDVKAANIANKIPAWYSSAVDSQYFLLLPIMANKRAIGLIYADMKTARSLQISKSQLSLLRTLRNQAVLAIKQKV